MKEEDISKLEARFESLLCDLTLATDKHGLRVILNDGDFLAGALTVFGDLREKNGLPNKCLPSSTGRAASL